MSVFLITPRSWVQFPYGGFNFRAGLDDPFGMHAIYEPALHQSLQNKMEDMFK